MNYEGLLEMIPSSLPILNQDKDPDPEPEKVVEKEQVIEEPPQPPPSEDIIHIPFKDFIAFSSQETKELSYLTINVSVELSDKYQNNIKENEPFFLYIIYEVVRKSLIVNGKDNLVQGGLEILLKNAFRKRAPEIKIESISILEFTVK